MAHIFGRGIRGHIKVLGFPPEQKITHTAADDVRGVASFAQSIEDLEGVFADIRPRDDVIGSRDYGWFENGGRTPWEFLRRGD